MVHNAQITLLATALNNLGVGSIIVGAVVPSVNRSVADFTHITAWLIFGLGLLGLTQLVLRRLTP